MRAGAAEGADNCPSPLRAHLLAPCILTRLLSRAELTRLPRGLQLSRAVPIQQPQPSRELRPIQGYLQPHKLGPGLQLLRSGGEVRGVAAFSSASTLQMKMLIRPTEETTSHHPLTFPPHLKYSLAQIFDCSYSHINPRV